MPKMDESKNEYRFRVKNPDEFDRSSIRTKALPSRTKAVNILVGCPKGHYNRRTEKCYVGTQTQAYRFKKTKFTKSGAERWVRKNVCPRNPKVCRAL